MILLQILLYSIALNAIITNRNKKGFNIRGIKMTLKYCSCCGRPVVKITTKSALFKAVCLDCEMTFKLIQEASGQEVIKVATSSPSQMTEAAMNK